jgi:hypothetical protein
MALTSHGILYIFVFILVVYLIIIGFIRIKMRFWHTQPVFHLYNLKYWLNPPGFINLGPPLVNKYVNLINNKLITLDVDGKIIVDESKTAVPSIEAICKFIQDYYVIHAAATYKPSPEDIIAYLQCSNHPAFFNVYQEPKMVFENGVPADTTKQELIGVTSSRVLNVMLRNKKKKIVFPVYYVDNLCVKPGYRKKGIPPEMIQTFYYNVSRTNSRVNAYMFKREGKLNAIVPLVYYDSYCFDIAKIQPTYALTAAMNVIEIGPQQLNVVVSFIKEQTTTFECVILPDVSSVLNLIKLGKLKMYGIIFNGEMIALYVFRPMEMYYEKKKTVECVTILSNCETDAILIAGFTASLAKLNTGTDKTSADKTSADKTSAAGTDKTSAAGTDKTSAAGTSAAGTSAAGTSAAPAAELLLIEDTAHSSVIIHSLNKNPSTPCQFKSPTAFFLYNYACYSAKNTKTLLLY